MKRFNEHYTQCTKEIGEKGAREPVEVTRGEFFCIINMLYDLAEEVDKLKAANEDLVHTDYLQGKQIDKLNNLK